MAGADTIGHGGNPSAGAGRDATPVAQTAATGDDQPVLKVRYKPLLTVAIMSATLLQVLDTTIANVALPHMQAALGATQDSITWVLTSYIVAAAISIPITGWLADRIGARRLFLISVASFVGASMLCGIARSLVAMVLFRLIQGVSGAFIAPLAQSLLFDINRKSDHARAMGIYGAGVMVGPIAGPIIGGWLTDNINWRWVFYVNVPVGVATFALLWFLLPEKKGERRRFDLTGFSILGIGLAALQLMLDRGEHIDWFAATEIWVEAGIALSCFWMFGVHILTGRNPLYPPDMLRDRNLIGGAGFAMIVGMVMMASMALLPSMLQTLFGYPVLTTGVLLSARGIGVLLVMPLVGILGKRIDSRLTIFVGFLILSFTLWQMTQWSLDMDWRPVFLAGLIQGLGVGMVFVPMNLIAFATLPPRYRTEGAALVNLMRNIGSSVGIAMTTSLLARNIQMSHADLSQHVTAARLPIDPNTIQALGATSDTVMAMVNAEVTRQAAMIAYLDDFKAMMFATIIVIPLVFLLKKASPPKPGDEPVVVME